MAGYDITKGDKPDNRNVEGNETARNIPSNNVTTKKEDIEQGFYTGPIKPSYKNHTSYYNYLEEAENQRQFDENTGFAYDDTERGAIGLLHRDYGESYYDKYAKTLGELQDLNEVRAREQGTISKLANGFGNYVLKTGTSFAGTLLGTVAGASQGFENLTDDDENTTFMSGMMNNKLQEVINDVNEWGEKMMPNYQSKSYQDKNPLAKMLTSTFWAQQMDNLGFTSGTILAITATAGLGAGSAMSSLASRLGASPKSSQFIYRLVSSIVGSSSEASMEGYQNYLDSKQHYTQELNDKYANQESAIKNKMQQETLARILQANPSLLTDNPQHNEELENRIKEEVAAKYDNEFKLLNEQKEKEAQSIEARANSAGTLTYGLNMAILVPSQMNGVMSFLKCGTSNAARMVKGSMFNAFRSQGAKQGISKAEAYAIGAREMLSEGFEEINQKWASNLAEQYYGADYDPKASKDMTRFLTIAGQSFKNVYSDMSSWDEFLAGAITGLTGAPSPHRDSNGKFRIFQGGLVEAIREGGELAERSQQAYDEMNKVINNKELRDRVKLSIANLASTNRQMELAGTGDKKGYIDEMNKLAIRTCQTFANAGRLNDLEALVGNTNDLSDEQLQQMAQLISTPDPNNKGKYVPDNDFVDENGELKAFGSKEQKDELRKKVEKKHNEFKRIIRNYRDAINEADRQTGYKLDQESLNILAWGFAQSKNWKDRIEDMYNLPEFQDAIKEAAKLLNNDIKGGEQALAKLNSELQERDILSKEFNSWNKGYSTALQQRKQEHEDRQNLKKTLSKNHETSALRIIDEIDSLEKEISNVEETISNEYKKGTVNRRYPKTRKKIQGMKKSLSKKYDKLVALYDAFEKHMESSKKNKEEIGDTYNEQEDGLIQAYLNKIKETKQSLDELNNSIKENEEIVNTGKKAKESKEALDDIDSKVKISSSLLELMDILNRDDLLNLLSNPNNSVSNYDIIRSVFSNSKMDEQKKQEVLDMLDDMEKCLRSSVTLNEYTKELANDPSKIDGIQNKIKNQVANEMSKQAVNDLDETLDDFSSEEKELIGLRDKLDDEGFNRLNDAQLQDLGNKYNEALQRAKNSLYNQLIILNWPKEKREQYVNNILNKAIKDKREKNKEFDNFLNALELSKQFSELFNDIVDGINFHGININDIKHTVRQLFESTNVFAYSHGFHPIFLSDDEIGELLDNLGYDINNDDVAAATYTCIIKMYDALKKNLNEANINGGVKNDIQGGNIVDGNNNSYKLDNPNNIERQKGDTTRDGTSQIEGVTVSGNVEKLKINTTSTISSPTPTETQQQPQTLQEERRKLNRDNNTPSTPIIPPQSNSGTQSTSNEMLKASGILELQVEIPEEAFANQTTSVTTPQDMQEAEKYMVNNGGREFIQHGGLREMLEFSGNIPVYASNVDGIDNVLFFYVKKDNGEFQVIGYLKEDTGNAVSWIAQNLFKQQRYNYNAEYNKSDGSVASVNINTDFKATNEPKQVFNEDGVPLRIVKVGDNGQPHFTNKMISISSSKVGNLSFEEASNNGNVFVRSNGVIVGDKENKAKYSGSNNTTPVILVRGSDGKLHHLQVNASMSMQEVLSNPENSMSKIFRKDIENTLNNILNEFNKQNNTNYTDIREIDFTDSKNVTSFRNIVQLEFNKFIKNNLYTKDKFKFHTANGSNYNQPLTTAKIYIEGNQGRVFIDAKVSEKISGENGIDTYQDSVLFTLDFDLLTNENTNDSKNDYTKQVVDYIYNQFVNLSVCKTDNEGFHQTDNEGNPIRETVFDSSKVEIDDKDRASKIITLRVNVNYKDEYNPNDVASTMYSYRDNLAEMNTKVGLSYTESDYDNNEIQWNKYAPNRRNKEFADDKQNNVITNTGGQFNFSRKKEKNGGYSNEWNVYQGEAADQNRGDAASYDAKDFLGFFDPNNILNGDIDKLNEVLTDIFSKNRKDDYIQTRHGVFDRKNGILIKEMPKQSSENNNSENQNPEQQPQQQQQQKPEEVKGNEEEEKKEKPSISNLNVSSDSEVEEDDDLFRKSSNTETLKIREGLHNGYLLFKQITKQMASKLSKLDQQLLDFISDNIDKKLRVKVLNDSQWAKFVELNPDMANKSGRYSVKNNCIYIKDKTDIITVLHEMTHAATVNAIKDAMQNNDVSIRDLQEVLNKLQNMYEQDPSQFSGIEGIRNFNQNSKSDLFELVAEVFANKKLQELLKNTQIGKKTIEVTNRFEIKENKPDSLFDRIINWITSLFRDKKPKYRTETVKKLIDYTLFDKFKDASLKLKNSAIQKTSETKKESTKQNPKNGTKKYIVYKNSKEPSNGVSIYNTNQNLGFGTETVDVSTFISKYNPDGSYNKEWLSLELEFNSENNDIINFNDNTDHGMKLKNKFYEFLKNKGYKGIDMVTGKNLAFTKYATDEMLISFDDTMTTDKKLASQLNTSEENINKLSNSAKESLKRCI